MKFLIAVFPLLLSACATPFVSSTHPQAATVTIRNATPDLKLAGFTFRDPEHCSGHVILPFPPVNSFGATALPPGGQVQISLEPERKFAFSLASSRPMEDKGLTRVLPLCGVTATFTPQAQKRYVIAFSWPDDQCSVTVSRVETIGGKDILQPEASAQKRLQSSGFASMEACQ